MAKIVTAGELSSQMLVAEGLCFLLYNRGIKGLLDKSSKTMLLTVWASSWQVNELQAFLHLDFIFFIFFFFSFESLLSLAVSEQTISVRTSQDVKIFLSPVKAMFFFSEKVRWISLFSPGPRRLCFLIRRLLPFLV